MHVNPTRCTMDIIASYNMQLANHELIHTCMHAVLLLPYMHDLCYWGACRKLPRLHGGTITYQETHVGTIYTCFIFYGVYNYIQVIWRACSYVASRPCV